MPLVVRSEDNEEKIVTIQILIKDHGSELYRKIVGNHAIKDCNTSQNRDQIKVVKTSYSALQLFDFTQFCFNNVSEYTKAKISSFSSSRPH